MSDLGFAPRPPEQPATPPAVRVRYRPPVSGGDPPWFCGACDGSSSCLSCRSARSRQARAHREAEGDIYHPD